MLDGDAARALADAVDDVPPQPARLLLRDGWRDDDLVDRRLELGERVADSVDRIGLDDEAVRGDPVVPAAAPSVRSSRRPAAARRVSS